MSSSNRIQNQIATPEETLNRLFEQVQVHETILNRTQNQGGKFNIQTIPLLQTPAQFKNLFSRILDNIDIDAEKLIKVSYGGFYLD
ncbi:hypothetical protein [Metabacillus bambusae]|uniref:Uncharacterized protein n=1 Tax=Metabacillus bambusae TaxID=2795218 RepID=A0ABS3N6X8_9BACI|nr:hypothetical protein [Metabacillus bambusae]MBO1513653.1 hypothetical protein [Metabacillus bambusae]